MDVEAENVKLNYRRKLTPFLCQEMLYEYAIGALDTQRRSDMEEFLASDRASQEALQALRHGLEYADKLGASRVAPELVEKLGDSENFFSLILRYMDWDEWPEALRWSVSALAISVMVAGIVTVVPWNKMPKFPNKKPSNTVVLADIPGSKGPGITGGPQGAEMDSDLTGHEGEHETSGDEHDTPDAHVTPPEPVAVAAPPPKPAPIAKPSPVEVKAAAKATPPLTAAATPAAVAQPVPSAMGDPDAETSVSEGKPKGFVYRAFMNISSVEEITPEVVSQLEIFGAEKAGEVPLGWRRGAGSYFHFTLPESNEAQVLEMLRGYGPVRISKDPHPRVMPSGQIRFILWIEPAS